MESHSGFHKACEIPALGLRMRDFRKCAAGVGPSSGSHATAGGQLACTSLPLIASVS